MLYRKKKLVKIGAGITRFEYSSLGSELKKQTSIAEKKYRDCEFDKNEYKTIKKEKQVYKKHNRSNLVYDSKHSFFEYNNIKYFNRVYLEPKYPILVSFYNDLNELNNLNPQNRRAKDKKECL